MLMLDRRWGVIQGARWCLFSLSYVHLCRPLPGKTLETPCKPARWTVTHRRQNVCGNAVAGGIDLAGLFPRYITIRRGAIITFLATWIIQPWQLINRAVTFVTVLSSFSVFLAPLIGVMTCDYFLIRRQKIRLNHLYRPQDSHYWFSHGFNWRVIPCWVAGWAPTIGGLIVSAGGMETAPKALYQLFYTAFFTGFGISFALFYATSLVFPVNGAGEYDEYDDWATFTPKEAARLRIVPHEDAEELGKIRFGASGYRRRAMKEQKGKDSASDVLSAGN